MLILEFTSWNRIYLPESILQNEIDHCFSSVIQKYWGMSVYELLPKAICGEINRPIAVFSDSKENGSGDAIGAPANAAKRRVA